MFAIKRIPKVRYSTATLFADFGKSSMKLHGKYHQNIVVRHGRLCSTPNYTRVCDASLVYGAVDTSNGLIYCSPTGTFVADGTRVVKLCNTMQYPTLLYCEKQSALVMSQKGLGTFVKAEEYAQALPVGFDTLAICKERVFGASGKTVYFSEAGDATLWNGQIILPERIFAVVEQDDSILAVGNNVYRLEIEGEDSKVTRVVQNVGTVFPKTVQCVGNRIFFLGPDGLRCVTQHHVKKIAAEANFHRENSSAVAAVCNGRYYISYTATNGNRQVAVVDCDTLSVLCYLNLDTTVLCGGNRLLFNVGDRLHTFGDGLAESFWVSNSVHFDQPTMKKSLKNLFVKTKNDVQVSVVTENERRVFNIDGSSILQKIPVRGTFTQVNLEVSGTGLDVEQLGLEVRKRGDIDA